MSEDNKKEIDSISGVETTGHEWDGLKELNNPLPRWWVWVFIVTCVWSLWYFVIYPAWPTPGGATEGTSGYTQYKELAKNQEEIALRQQTYLNEFEKAEFEDILNNQELYTFAVAGGEAAFKDNCATCHGSGASGSKGYPNLNDDDWLWGGTIDDIHTTLLHGIRVANSFDTRLSQMPAFGTDGLLTKPEIDDVVDYVLALSGEEDPSPMSGHQIFQQNCASCHGTDGKGLREFGAPNLTDAIWLYGSDRKTIYETVYNSRAGMMPAWKERLDENTIRQLAVYVHELGGGEPTPEPTPEPEPEEIIEPDIENSTPDETISPVEEIDGDEL